MEFDRLGLKVGFRVGLRVVAGFRSGGIVAGRKEVAGLGVVGTTVSAVRRGVTRLVISATVVLVVILAASVVDAILRVVIKGVS